MESNRIHLQCVYEKMDGLNSETITLQRRWLKKTTPRPPIVQCCPEFIPRNLSLCTANNTVRQYSATLRSNTRNRQKPREYRQTVAFTLLLLTLPMWPFQKIVHWTMWQSLTLMLLWVIGGVKQDKWDSFVLMFTTELLHKLLSFRQLLSTARHSGDQLRNLHGARHRKRSRCLIW